jgi:hypothetical protein
MRQPTAFASTRITFLSISHRRGSQSRTPAYWPRPAIRSIYSILLASLERVRGLFRSTLRPRRLPDSTRAVAVVLQRGQIQWLIAPLPAVEGLARDPEMTAGQGYVLALAVEIHPAQADQPRPAQFHRLSALRLHVDTLLESVTNHSGREQRTQPRTCRQSNLRLALHSPRHRHFGGFRLASGPHDDGYKEAKKFKVTSGSTVLINPDVDISYADLGRQSDDELWDFLESISNGRVRRPLG